MPEVPILKADVGKFLFIPQKTIHRAEPQKVYAKPPLTLEPFMTKVIHSSRSSAIINKLTILP